MIARERPYALFIALWWITGAVLFALSAMTVWRAHIGVHHDIHAIIIGLIEAIGAVLFLLPGSVRIGSALLLLALAFALIAHTAAGQFRGDLLVYAAVVAFVAANAARARITVRTNKSL
jgi:uncharacterized membrane protein YphA (DoxX/SURF4 family)